MVVYEWIQRFLAPVAAPDSNFQPKEDEGSLFWDLVAPDPKFTPPPPSGRRGGGGPSSASSLAPRSTEDSSSTSPLVVECQYCHRMTPSSASRPDVVASAPETPLSATTGAATTRQPTSSASLSLTPLLATPLSSASNTATPSSALDNQLREAAHSTLLLSSPGFQHKRKKAERVFQLLNEVTFYNDTKHTKLTTLVTKDPNVVTYARVQKGSALPSVPEGYTPLQVAASQGNLRAVQLFLQAVPLELALKQVQQTTPKGETALHLACTYGHDPVVTVLQQFCIDHGLDWQSRDLLGRTPLGAGLTAPQGKARASSLLKALLSPEDVCVFGTFVPPRERCFYNVGPHETALTGGPTTAVAVGIAEMPGRRGQMEDATLVTLSDPNAESAPTWSVVGVLDGHDDGGLCSHAAALHLERLLREHCSHGPSTTDETAVMDLFQTVDDLLRHQNEEIPGGATACVAIVTEQCVQVANVGDSRCVLIQRVPSQPPVTDPTPASEDDDNDDTGMAILEDSLQKLELGDATKLILGKETYSVTALSHDHKPNLPEERRRIEAAGLQVQEIRYEAKGQPQVVYKVTRSMKMSQIDLATSRTFGDFEFKSNANLPSDQQAVVAVPEIVTVERTHQDELLILACDGVWDVMTNVQAAEFVLSQLRTLGDEPHALALVADRLCRKCFDLDSDDNMSVAIVALGSTADHLASVVRANEGLPPRHLFADSPSAGGVGTEGSTSTGQDPSQTSGEDP